MSLAMQSLTKRYPEFVEAAIADAFKNRGFLTWNHGIQMWAIDRPVASCTHRTSFCRQNCYTRKAYTQYHHMMPASDIKNEYRWGVMTGDKIAAEIAGKNQRARARAVSRVRFCTKGEPFSEINDIDLVKDIAVKNPEVLFWIPTRAWRQTEFREAIEVKLFQFLNLSIMASIDPSNSIEEVQMLDKSGWSKMFFGHDNVEEAEAAFRTRFAKCPKTHKGLHGSCRTCNLCFTTEQINVHLKKH